MKFYCPHSQMQIYFHASEDMYHSAHTQSYVYKSEFFCSPRRMEMLILLQMLLPLTWLFIASSFVLKASLTLLLSTTWLLAQWQLLLVSS